MTENEMMETGADGIAGKLQVRLVEEGTRRPVAGADIQITYEGSLADWNAVKKNNNWDGHSNSTTETPLTKIQCLDGYMEYVAGTKTWKEVKS